MRKSIIGLIMFLVGAAAVAWMAGSPTSAQPAFHGGVCNRHTLAGNYIYSGFGTVGTNPIGLPPGPYNTSARLVLDRQGNFEIDAMTSYNGTLVPEHFEGTYEIGPGCSVTYLTQFPGAPTPIPAVFAYASQNRGEARGVSLLPGTNVTFLTVEQ